MENYRKMSHCTYDIKYHIVWITKYRKPVLKRPIAERTRELVRMVCAKNDVEILAGHVGIDHIHLREYLLIDRNMLKWSKEG